MSKSVHIHVPKPCHENWQNMTPKEQGRFCGSCQKIVVDFSKMSDKEMLDQISKTAGQSMCGRFTNDQLNRKIEPATKKRRFSFAYAWSLLLATALLFESCDESTTGEVERVEVVENDETLGKIAVDDNSVSQQSPTEIKGTIFNEGSGLPVAGVQVHITGSKQNAVSDSTGKFSLLNDAGDSVLLEISAPDFITKTMQLNNKSDLSHVKVMMRDVYTKGEFRVEENVTNDVRKGCKNEK